MQSISLKIKVRAIQHLDCSTLIDEDGRNIILAGRIYIFSPSTQIVLVHSHVFKGYAFERSDIINVSFDTRYVPIANSRFPVRSIQVDSSKYINIDKENTLDV